MVAVDHKVIEREVNWPKLSVVIPTRDRPQLLRKAVKSVLEQDYPGKIECLVIFDQCPITPVSIEFNTDQRELRLLSNTRTPGLPGARNSGVLVAKGELVSFLDDDDEWLPQKAREQVQVLRKAGRTSIGCGICIQYAGRQFAKFPPRVITLPRLLRSFSMALHPSTWMLPRADQLKIMFDEKMRYAEDHEWLLRVARRMRIIVLQEPLVRVNWERKSWFAGRWANIIQGLEYMLNKHPELRQDARGLARIYGQIAFAYAAIGRKREAERYVGQGLSLKLIETRGYLSLLLLPGAVNPRTILRPILHLMDIHLGVHAKLGEVSLAFLSLPIIFVSCVASFAGYFASIIKSRKAIEVQR